jgi:hypothetical protein
MRSKFFYPVTLIAFIWIISCAGMNSQIELEKSGIQYSKPQTSTQLVKGEKVEYELWFNKNKWKVLNHENPNYKIVEEHAKNNNIYISHVLLSYNSNEITAMTEESRVPITLETIFKYNSKLIRARGSHIISSDVRMVNGNNVLYIKFGATIDSIKWIYLNYYLSNKTGAARVMVGTTENLFAEHESDMIDLLNGFVDPNSKIKPTKSDNDIESRLIKLKKLMDKGLITQEDYDKKKNKLLNSY